VMPVYDYQCDLCGHVFELRTRMDIVSILCPRCNGDARRVPVYRDQYINGETVAKGGRRASEEQGPAAPDGGGPSAC
jgi:putative FmdB family regulatory protein